MALRYEDRPARTQAAATEIREISVLGGFGRNGEREPVARLDLRMGDVISVLGPTGSGKTALINDIALFADADTPSRRRVLVDGAPPEIFGEDPAHNPIALITQHTTFLSDLPVREFLRVQARVRRGAGPESIVEETLAFANELTGEPIIEQEAMTELSGGQTRALLLAHAVVIGNSPIVLLDEIENAGIDRLRALELLERYRKIFVFVTHDLRIALLSDRRVILLRCAPYIEGALGVVVLEATSGMNVPRKIGAMLSLADLAVVTKIGLVSQAEKEVFRANLLVAAAIAVVETDALRGINLEPVVRRIEATPELVLPTRLRGSPPMAVCTICAGKKEIGWEHHYGIVRALDSDLFYRGQ